MVRLSVAKDALEPVLSLARECPSTGSTPQKYDSPRRGLISSQHRGIATPHCVACAASQPDPQLR